MRLIELDPGFLEHPEKGRMLMLLCPKCGGHHVGIPVTNQNVPGRWFITNEDFNTITVKPSIRFGDNPPKGACLFHFSITDGQIVDN